jgi:hypothetical protein
MKRLGSLPTLLWLGLVFLSQIVTAGLSTAWQILRPGAPPEPGFLWIRFSGLSPTGASLLGSLVTLTPGTTTLDIDLQREEMLLHLLDSSDPEGDAREIERRFERPIRRIFPAGGTSGESASATGTSGESASATGTSGESASATGTSGESASATGTSGQGASATGTSERGTSDDVGDEPSGKEAS